MSASDDFADQELDYTTIDNCPYCHQQLQGWGCVTCGVECTLEDNTRLVERASDRKP